MASRRKLMVTLQQPLYPTDAACLPSSVTVGGGLICKLPGCTRLRYMEQYGYTHDFCGRTHAELFRRTYGTGEKHEGVYRS